MANKKNPFAFLSGILVGGAVGAAVAALFTPQSGKKTRKQLKEKGEQALGQSKKAFNKVKKEQVEPLIKKVEKEAKEKFEELKGKSTKK